MGGAVVVVWLCSLIWSLRKNNAYINKHQILPNQQNQELCPKRGGDWGGGGSCCACCQTVFGMKETAQYK